MSRSGYNEDVENVWALICYRGAVASGIRGKRGQAFLQEMLTALDALPEKKLIASELEMDGQVCAIGSVGRSRGVDMSQIDPEESWQVARAFGISEALSREIVYMNDEGHYALETPEQRFTRMRAWIVENLKNL